jgi:hypothetical protein
LVGRQRFGCGLQAHAEVGAIHAPSCAELVGDPQKVSNRDREAEVILASNLPRAGRWRSQPASDQAQKLTAEVRHHSAAVARIERGLDLDQTTELA